MHLYLKEEPRTLLLVTSSREESQGRPQRVLIFRAVESNSSQAVVEFLPKKEVDLSNAVRLTSRIVKGCLGLISVGRGILLFDLQRMAINNLVFIQKTCSWLS